MTTSKLAPFWRYYGGKFRSAPRYPQPEHETIVEPFAGAAGYSLRHHDRKVLLVERYPVVAELWRFLIGVKESEILRIPEVEHVDSLHSWVPEGGRILVGFSMNSAVTAPRKSLSAGRIKLRAMGRKFEGWNVAQRERVASQLRFIRHWKIVEGDYTLAPNARATWFVDPPYQVAGSHYVHRRVDYAALAEWCRERQGQVIVCENAGANWLPFRVFGAMKSGPSKRISHEMIWTQEGA